MAPMKFASALEATSYQSPFDRSPTSPYAPARKHVIETALAMGYDPATMVEYSVTWGDDQDPFNHVKNAAFPHYANMCNLRVFQSFEKQLGKEKYEDLMGARHIGCIIQSYTTTFKRQVRFPDSIVLASKITEVQPDRYFSIVSMWSLTQQAIVSDCAGYSVFFDWDRGVPANLLKVGGEHADLYHALVKRKDDATVKAAEWDKKNPKKPRAPRAKI